MQTILVQRNADFIQWNLTDCLWILANFASFVYIKQIHFSIPTGLIIKTSYWFSH